MPVCPICTKPLETIRQRNGLFYHCPDCQGRALSIPQLRMVAGDQFAARLLRLIKASRRKGARACPFCGERMAVIDVADPPMELDGCRPCNLVWFEQQQYEAVPEGAAEIVGTLSALATEMLAMQRLKELKEREAAEKVAEKKRKSLRGTLKRLWDQ
ncbi:MAG: rhomboid family serine protease [Pedosphaera sp.]|nr:rhomboid family serine protease [Pedosphaera sp.]